ncbi:hypothetical protein HBE96_17525 [Clostridium sp. P21]|uniref:Uncharacterized protein n=1 Tax=Clostridium muellerianum TaxID=2716538 RepID=A0A7Y0EJS8_9CLOT|nr:hypothetical protein [Clostridium muellerianum]NMM64422.1 hypothetical protein [Clostridium muellerianum]
MDLSFDKSVIEVEISTYALEAAKTKWGWRSKSLISQVLEASLKKELGIEKDDKNYMESLRDKLENDIIKNGVSDSTEIYSFEVDKLSMMFGMDLPYSPEINIEIINTERISYIRFKGKETSRAFRDYLSMALDKINGSNGIKKLYVSVAEIKVPLEGTLESIDDDVFKIVSRIKETLQHIYNALCEVYRKKSKVLF